MASPLPHWSYAAKKVSNSRSTSALKASACTALLYTVSTSAESCTAAMTAVVTYLPAQQCVTFPGDRLAPVVPNTSTYIREERMWRRGEHKGGGAVGKCLACLGSVQPDTARPKVSLIHDRTTVKAADSTSLTLGSASRATIAVRQACATSGTIKYPRAPKSTDC